MNLSLFQQNIEKQLDAGCSHPEGDLRATAVSNCCTSLQAPVTRPSAVNFTGQHSLRRSIVRCRCLELLLVSVLSDFFVPFASSPIALDGFNRFTSPEFADDDMSFFQNKSEPRRL